MASVRRLKKDVNQLAYELLTEAFTYKRFHKDLDESKFDEIIRNVVKSRNDILARINNPEINGRSASGFYSEVKEDMFEMTKLLSGLRAES